MRKIMAVQAVTQQNISICKACQVFSASEACYRYQPTMADENTQIAQWLIRLTSAHTDWIFGLFFDYLRNKSLLLES